MVISKKSVILSVVCLFMFSFVGLFFMACNENLSYDDFKKSYNQTLENYDGVFFSEKNVSFFYNQELQTLIDNGTEDDGLQKLSKYITSGQAIFEPVLRVSFEAINFFVDTQDTSRVSQDSLKDLKNKLNDLNSAFASLKKDKSQLEEVSFSKQQVLNWILDYEKSFKNTIAKANDFALSYLNMYEKEILSERDVDGRISPKTTTFLIVKSMVQASLCYQKFVLDEVYDQKITTGQNFSNAMLQNFLSVKDILKNDFNSIRSGEKTTYEDNMVENFSILKEFQSKLNNSIANATVAVTDFSIKTLRRDALNGNLTFAEKVCLKAVDDLLNVDFPSAKGYNENIIKNIKEWNTYQGD